MADAVNLRHDIYSYLIDSNPTDLKGRGLTQLNSHILTSEVMLVYLILLLLAAMWDIIYSNNKFLCPISSLCQYFRVSAGVHFNILF